MSSSVKTAISLKQSLFDDVNDLANELKISRSKVFVLAVEDFLKKYENKKMLSKINEAFSDYPDEKEVETNTLMKSKQRKILEREQW